MNTHRPAPLRTGDDTSATGSTDSTPRLTSATPSSNANEPAFDLATCMSMDLERLGISPVPASARFARGDSQKAHTLFAPQGHFAQPSTGTTTPPRLSLVRNESSRPAEPEAMAISPYPSMNPSGADDMLISPHPSMQHSSALPPVILGPNGQLFFSPNQQALVCNEALEPTAEEPEDEISVVDHARDDRSSGGSSSSDSDSSIISNSGPPTPGVRGSVSKSALAPSQPQPGDAAVGLLYDQIMEKHYGPGEPTCMHAVCKRRL